MGVKIRNTKNRKVTRVTRSARLLNVFARCAVSAAIQLTNRLFEAIRTRWWR